MKILFITPRFDNSSGGDGIYALRLAAGLREEHLDIHVLTLKERKFVHITFDESYNENEINNNSNIELLSNVEYNLFAINYYSNNARRSLKYILSKIHPDIIHVHGIHQYFTISSMLELRKYHKPILFTIHDYKIICGNAGFFSDRKSAPCLKCLEGRFIPPLFERCKKNSYFLSAATSLQMWLWKVFRGLDIFDSFLIGSNSTYNLLKNNKEIAARLKIILFPSHSEPYNVSNVDNFEINIGFIGRFVPLKGITIFADSVNNLDLPIHIFGSGNQERDVKSKLKNKPNVVFHGWQNLNTISQILKLGSIVVLPYLTYENTCLTLVECMSRGCCVIGTNRGYFSEIIVNNQNGIMIDDPTPENFRNQIELLLLNHNRIIEMGKNAINTIINLPKMNSHTRELTDYYNSLVSKA